MQVSGSCYVNMFVCFYFIVRNKYKTKKDENIINQKDCTDFNVSFYT